MTPRPRARLRRLGTDDDGALVRLFGDPEVAMWNPGPGAADVQRWRAENTEPADDFRTWAVTDETDELLGVVCLFSIEDATHTAEIGIRIAGYARGQGLGRAALDLAMTFGSHERGVRSVEAWHAVGNVASCRLLTACGLTLVTHVPANYRYGDGQLHDEHRHVRVLTD